MPALYTHTTRATGTILTATIYNGDHQNHIDNGIPAQLDDYSGNVPQMQTATDPGEVGSESLATSMAGEFERLRYAIKDIKGTTQWYESPAVQLNSLSQASFRNFILNGEFRQNQQNQGATTIHGTYLCDMWVLHNTTIARVTVQQADSSSPYFPKKMLFTVTTAGAPGAGDFYGCVNRIEGTTVDRLDWGGAGAKTCTLSMLVNCSITGTFAATIRNGADNRSYVVPIVINAANTWEQKSWVIPGDLAGTWDTSSSLGMTVVITLACGATFSTASTETWLAGNFIGINGMTQFTNSPGATFNVTAVQLEEGIIRSPYERIPYEVELHRCQRYLEILSCRMDGNATAGGQQFLQSISMKADKRVVPIITYTSSLDSNVSTFDFPSSVNGAVIWQRVVSTAAGSWAFHGTATMDARF